MNIPIEEIRFEGGTMRFFRFGKGIRNLVILPGLSIQSVMQSASAVEEEYRIMENDFTVYVFDRRTELPPAYPIVQMASDTAKAITALGLRNTFLFGASQGGMIAMVLAIEYPELVQKLVLGSSSSRMDPSGFAVLQRWIHLAENGSAEALYLDFGKSLYPSQVFMQVKDNLITAAKTVTNHDLRRFVTLAKGMENFDVTDRLDAILCPTLAIGSADDAVLGPDAICDITEKLKDKPGFQSYVYDGYGHAAFDAAPDYQERILRFFLES